MRFVPATSDGASGCEACHSQTNEHVFYGVPLGENYGLIGLQLGIFSRCRKNLMTTQQYGCCHDGEPSFGDASDYAVPAASAWLAWRRN